ncbi:uncharacterized protein KGF55_004148 [Candida pseudojiufengensis]|uniref:uncharacterized protein n=1 Tax=Candida pseudojiufengensis TaxID=497109 RepID=UPI002224BB5F|nr:uncharacterized protein KGF55_004148 [Candida pseudojiufengensis]KAI5961223.1 hypothetical protein KGF55_004148 [Candida pseudojiufengensis]
MNGHKNGETSKDGLLSNGQYKDENTKELYKYLLKILLLEYSNETRFRTPIITPKKVTSISRNSAVFDSILPSQVIKSLKSRLQDIMTKKIQIDEKSRRSLLRLYGDLLDPSKEIRNVDFLISKFASYADQELRKMGDEDAFEMFRQSSIFIDMLISMLNPKKENEQTIITRLNERKKEFKEKQTSKKEVFVYPQKSYRVDDMNESLLSIIREIFGVDNIKIQTDIFKYKDLSDPYLLHKDVDKLISLNNEEYVNTRNSIIASQLRSRYKYVTEPTVALPANENYFVIPSDTNRRNLYIHLTSLLSNTDKDILGNNSLDFLHIVARVWFIDSPTKVAALYQACNESEYFLSASGLDLVKARHGFSLIQKIIEDSGLSWEDREKWSADDQNLWIENLTITYNQLFASIRECFTHLFDEKNKPKFGPYLEFLQMYIEQDNLFQLIEESGLPKKWEKRLTKSLLKVAGKRYETCLENIPRDDTLNVIHLFNICDTIVNDIKSLQKKYKKPFLGFLNVSRTVASITTGMFSSDAKMILIHIQNYMKLRHEVFPVADALELYKSLSEIRDIYYQVSTPSASKFQFDLEPFFYPYIDSWAEESEDKLKNIVEEALKKDDYQPININENAQKNSKAVLDILAIVKQYLSIMNKLGWQNEYQLAKLYTKLLRAISSSLLFYSDQITFKLNRELAVTKSEVEESQKNWFDEVKNVVSNIQGKAEPSIVYNFEAETCVSLNNIEAMMENFAKVEDWLDPESISNSLTTFEPQNNYLSHVFTVRVLKAENLTLSKESTFGRINPYVALADFNHKRPIGKTRVIRQTSDPEWDEDFEITIPANTILEISAIVWSESMGQHQVCGKTIFELNPKKFKHNGFPEEIILDLDLSGKLIIEVAVENETLDALFVMGRAYRALKRAQEKSIKLMVEKFSGFIEGCFSKANVKAVCSKGNPANADFEASIETLCDYLNLNLSTLKANLRDDLFMQVMLATWNVVIKSADELLLPKLSKAKVDATSWQSMSSRFANTSITSAMSKLGYDTQLSGLEIETVLRWLDLLTDFFHNEGNGPPLEDLKTDKYQSLLLIPAFYDQSDDELIDEVERLSPAFVNMLTNKNDFVSSKNFGRAGTLSRSKTIQANATVKKRAQAAKDAKRAKTDINANMVSKEDIILRILLARGRKDFVRLRLSQRTKLAYSVATERMARIAAEKKFDR